MSNSFRFEVMSGIIPTAQRKDYHHLINGDIKRWNERLDASIVSVRCLDGTQPIAFSFCTEDITAPAGQILRPVELGGCQSWNHIAGKA